VKLCGALQGRRAEVEDTRALLEPYAEWAGLASVYLLAGFPKKEWGGPAGRRISSDTIAAYELVPALSRQEPSGRTSLRLFTRYGVPFTGSTRTSAAKTIHRCEAL
jgi:hypothetical protein